MTGRVVLDASVALKWSFDDEPDIERARDLLARRMRREIDVVVPSHWPLEVLNGLWSAVRRGRVEATRAREHADAFLALGIPTADIGPLASAIYRAAVELDRTAYDAAYIVLAETKGLDFVTADERLFNAVKASKPFVKHLRDYEIPPPLPPPVPPAP